jgi:hypothetical protein
VLIRWAFSARSTSAATCTSPVHPASDQAATRTRP